MSRGVSLLYFNGEPNQKHMSPPQTLSDKLAFHREPIYNNN